MKKRFLATNACMQKLDRSRNHYVCVVMHRNDLEEYESACGYDRRLGGCPSNERCRLAVLNSLGTVMATNCTCPPDDRTNVDRLRCTSALQQLQQQNICKGELI